jgi:GH25 family lysozyme M1 (1,4-beta-N-acetylmuramidase)
MSAPACVSVLALAGGLGGVGQAAADSHQAAGLGESGTLAQLNGIDVSKFQGNIDWRAVKQGGVVFAYTRALEGETIRDPKFKANRASVKQAGAIRGAYGFYVAADPPEA